MKGKKDTGIIELEEISRTYIYSGGNEVTIDNAVECRINNKNTHRLITNKGEIYIVPYKWLSMKYIPIIKDLENEK